MSDGFSLVSGLLVAGAIFVVWIWIFGKGDPHD